MGSTDQSYKAWEFQACKGCIYLMGSEGQVGTQYNFAQFHEVVHYFTRNSTWHTIFNAELSL